MYFKITVLNTLIDAWGVVSIILELHRCKLLKLNFDDHKRVLYLALKIVMNQNIVQQFSIS